MAKSPDDGRTLDAQHIDSSTLATISRAEIDMQIETAKRHPRSLKRFRDEAIEMVTLTESIARECIYALPRDKKVIEGPSARFAEIMCSAWGNCRAGARVVSETGDFVTAQGVFQDLERNVAITYEVQRRIVDSKGRRYGVDMIGVTANAACSIALRNAILKGIPKAFWSDQYQRARQTVRGDFKTLNNRRAEAIAEFQGFGVSKEQLLAKLELKGVEDIGLDELVVLQGILTTIKEQEVTPEEIFPHLEEGVKQPQARDPAQSGDEQREATAQTSTAQDGGTGPGPSADGQSSSAPVAQQQSEPAVTRTNRRRRGEDDRTRVIAESGGTAYPAQQTQQQQPPPPQAPARATANMLKQIELRCESYSVDMNKMLGAIGAEKLEELTIAQANDALKWIEQNA